MENIKSIEELTAQLAKFEQDITDGIKAELIRIGRSVAMDEFEFIPFNEEVRDYIDTIHLDSNSDVVLDTSFSDMDEKYLSAFIADNEIDHWNMIGLLELLITIQK
jgi:hypothetical protein